MFAMLEVAVSEENKDQRIVVLMTPTESAAVDDWSFANKIRSKGEAIRRLCQIGLTYQAERSAIDEKGERLLSVSRAALDGLDIGDTQQEFDDWLGKHLDQENELIEAAIELVFGLKTLDSVGRYFADGDKNPLFHRAEELRQKLKEVRTKRDNANKKPDK